MTSLRASTRSPAASEPPLPPAAMNGWGRYISAETASIRREMDQIHGSLTDHKLRLRSLEAKGRGVLDATKGLAWKFGLGLAVVIYAKLTKGTWPSPHEVMQFLDVSP